MGPDFIIPPPDAFPYDRVVGGHALMAVGYDDTIVFGHGEARKGEHWRPYYSQLVWAMAG